MKMHSVKPTTDILILSQRAINWVWNVHIKITGHLTCEILEYSRTRDALSKLSGYPLEDEYNEDARILNRVVMRVYDCMGEQLPNLVFTVDNPQQIFSYPSND